ncbi:MAG: aspartate-semialdehyde dehydrogenase [Gammaproteobacteria bacterium]|nr:aspartate-semialdehyde dehydrogenase [Gammaproteobacteria bacterium]
MSGLINIAVIGANTEVGGTAIALLKERAFSIKRIYRLADNVASEDDADLVADFDFSKVDIAFFFTDIATARKYIPKAIKAGCRVIDASAAYSCAPDVPLIVPEVNADTIDASEQQIIASPSCTSIQLSVVLKPILEAYGLTNVSVASYEAVSDKGRAGISELASQTAELLNGQSVENSVFDKQIAFNVLPQHSDVDENGNGNSERKVIEEMHLIFANEITVMCNLVYVPIFYGNSCVINFATKKKAKITDIKKLLHDAPGIIVMEDEDCPTPRVESQEQDAVFVGRIKNNPQEPHMFSVWAVTDNTRKGAALNAVQIAELLNF